MSLDPILAHAHVLVLCGNICVSVCLCSMRHNRCEREFKTNGRLGRVKITKAIPKMITDGCKGNKGLPEHGIVEIREYGNVEMWKCGKININKTY